MGPTPLIRLKYIDCLLKHSFEYLFDCPAADALNGAGGMGIGAIIFSVGDVQLLWVPLPEGEISDRVLDLLGHNKSVCAGSKLPLYPHIADLRAKRLAIVVLGRARVNESSTISPKGDPLTLLEHAR